MSLANRQANNSIWVYMRNEPPVRLGEISPCAIGLWDLRQVGWNFPYAWRLYPTWPKWTFSADLDLSYIHFNKVQYNRHSENCKHFHSLRFDYNLSHLQKKGLIRINEPCTMAIKGFMLWNFKVLSRPMVWYLQGVPKKTPNYWNNVLLEFECLSTLLNPQVHKILT